MVNYQAINMRNDYYSPGTVTALLQTDLVTSQTKHELNKRLEPEEVTIPKFFDAESFTTLHAVSSRLIPQHRTNKIDIAGMLDTEMKKGRSDGWRFNTMPPDTIAFHEGLKGIDETSMLLFGSSFHLLSKELQEEVLRSLICKMAPGETWKQIPSNLFFEELLAALVEIYYSHPLAQEEIGVVALADAKGWKKIGLDELEEHEPKTIKESIK